MKKLSVILSIFILSVLTACGDHDSLKPAENVSATEASEEEQPIIVIGEAEAADNGTNPIIGNISECDSSDEEVSYENPENEGVQVVTLRMVGDILLHTPVDEAAKREDGTYDYSAIFANTGELIGEADLALANQEVIIGGSELGVSGYPAFNAPYEIGDALVEAGFDGVLHATNHALDKGGKGVGRCMEYWTNTHPEMEVMGIHDSSEDQQEISVFDINGMKIAVLNYTYGTNGIELPNDMPYAVDMLDESRVRADIEKAEEVSDFVVVCPHWGTEYRLSPDSYQEKWMRIFLEGGVDLCIGTHPHVIEPLEMVRDDETGNEMLVYYSLGNFVNWTSGTGDGVANRMVGGMADVVLKREDEQVKIDDYKVIALVTDLREGQDGVTVYPLSSYTEAMADSNEIRKQDAAFSLEYCQNLCNQIWGDNWK